MYDTYLINYGEVPEHCPGDSPAQLNTQSYSIQVISLFALQYNSSCLMLSKIFKVSEVQWQRLTWPEIVVGSKVSLLQSRQPPNLQRWQWMIADRSQRSRHVCHPLGWMKKFQHLLPDLLICLEFLWSYPLHSPIWSHTCYEYRIWILDRIIEVFLSVSLSQGFQCKMSPASPGLAVVLRCHIFGGNLHQTGMYCLWWMLLWEISCILSSSKSVQNDYSLILFDIVDVCWFLSLWFMAVVAIWCVRGWPLLQSLLAAIWDVRTSDGCSPGGSR